MEFILRKPSDFDFWEPRDHPPLVGADGRFNGRNAGGAAVHRMERLIALSGFRDHHIRFVPDQETGRRDKERRADERHVTRNDSHSRIFGGNERGVESAQWTAIRHKVRKEGEPEERKALGLIRRNKELVRNRRKPVNHALDQGLSLEGFERLVLAHAYRLAAGLHHDT